MTDLRELNRTVKVWDPVVRYGHWLLVLAFFVAYLSEDDFLTVHTWAGYAVGIIVLVRLCWGFVGSTHARFTDFVTSPGETLDYLRDLTRRRAKRYIGHNPAGAAMIVALLLSLSGTVFSGLLIYAIEEQAGPLVSWVEPDPNSSQVGEHAAEIDESDDAFWEDFWEEAHEILANLTLLLIVLHIGGVLLASRSHHENLVLAMLTGRKRAEQDQENNQ